MSLYETDDQESTTDLDSHASHYPSFIEGSDKLLPHQEANQGGIRKGKHPVRTHK